MENLRHVVMVRVLHVFKLCSWSRCLHKFPCAGRVRRYLPVVLFPKIWILSHFLSSHLRIFDFWALGGLHIETCRPDVPKFCGGRSLVSHGLRNTKLTGFAFAGIIGLGFAIGERSLEVASWPLFDMALCFPIGSERKLLKGLQETIEKFVMLNKRRRWSTHHAWNVLWLACRRVVFWCQHIWFGSSVLNWFCRTTNQAQLCGFWTRVSLPDFVLCFDVFKDVRLRLASRRMCVGGYVIHIWQLLNLSLFLLKWWMISCRAQVSSSLLCLAVLFEERHTSITVSQRSRASSPSMRNPASKEMISDSVELWDTDVCFLHIQLMETSVWLLNVHKTPPEVDSESSRSPAMSESWNKLGRQCWAHPGNVSVAPAEIRDSNIFVDSSIIISFGLHSRWVHPKYTWSRN